MSQDNQAGLAANIAFVGVQGDMVIMMKPPAKFTKLEALQVAAYLVVMASIVDGECPTFEEVKQAVENT